MRGIAGGFTQANHGKKTVLQRLSAGDKVVFYSPRTSYQGGESLQAFTALATVADGTLYQVDLSPDFAPWRRKLVFDAGVQETPVRPLIHTLSFIPDKTHWGYRFRFGLFEIPEADYEVIAQAMQTAHTTSYKRGPEL